MWYPNFLEILWISIFLRSSWNSPVFVWVAPILSTSRWTPPPRHVRYEWPAPAPRSSVESLRRPGTCDTPSAAAGNSTWEGDPDGIGRGWRENGNSFSGCSWLRIVHGWWCLMMFIRMARGFQRNLGDGVGCWDGLIFHAPVIIHDFSFTRERVVKHHWSTDFLPDLFHWSAAIFLRACE